ncbi:MAG: helix-turn-helix domain-containing protein [Clostridia bacterium]|nr:helix-turn-helix domain-containing protein [Clostridia bacterium]
MQYLTTKQVMEHFNVKDSRTITKFRRQGLKYIEIGTKDYRYDPKDIEEFEEHLKELAQEKVMQGNPIVRKRKSKTVNIDYEKLRANRMLNRVV